MAYRKLAYFTVLIFIINCSKTSESKISDHLVEKLSLINDSLPSAFVGYNLYVNTDSDSVLVGNVNSLHEIYINHYQKEFKDFHSFLFSSLKDDFRINNDEVKCFDCGKFVLDTKIANLPIESVKRKYFEENKNDKVFYFYPRNFSFDTKQTILYKMFLDGYLISFDDYGGKFNISYDPSNYVFE